eukprot:c28299_g1_i1 orf=1172-2098(-)
MRMSSIRKFAPKRSRMSNESSSCSPPDKAWLWDLVEKVNSGQAELQRVGAKELRRAAKISSANRSCIGEMGAIPRLIKLLSVSADAETQIHAVTALMNLTLRNDRNRQEILVAGGVDAIVETLERGPMEARENAAATVFSLCSRDGYTAFIGLSDVFPGLINLLVNGTPRGKKDAAAALYRLSLLRQNVTTAVRSGAVPPLLQLVQAPDSGLVNESLTVIFNLSSHQEGRFAIGNASGVRILIDLIRDGSDRNKEYSAAVLCVLCKHDCTHSSTARRLGGYEVLIELSQSGSEKARQKAAKILEYMNR